VDKEKMLKFAEHQVGDHYSFLTILSIALDIATPNWFPAFRRSGTWICSALAGESLRAGGWIHDWGDVYTVTPAQLWFALMRDEVNLRFVELAKRNDV
jgi:hypothetical protein